MDQQPSRLGLHRAACRGAAPAVSADGYPDRQRVDERPGHLLRHCASAPIRPNSTVPNTTSSRPAVAASTRAHTRWNSVAADTPSARRALPHPRGQVPGSTASRAAQR